MKNKLLSIVAIIVVLGILGTTASGGQTPWMFVSKSFTAGGATLLNTDTTGSLLESNGALALNNVSGVPVVVKAGVSRLVTINVLTASGVGAAYDSATVASGVAANKVFSIPATVGTYAIDWPMASGIIVDPSSSVLSIKYN